MPFAIGGVAGLALAVGLLASLAFGSFASSLTVTGSLSSGAASFLGFFFTFALLIAATWATEFAFLNSAQNIIDNSNNSYIKGDHNKVEQVTSQEPK